MLAGNRGQIAKRARKVRTVVGPGTCYRVCTMVRRLPAVLLAGLGVACASPTLPLPPPSLRPTQSPGVDADHVTLSAGCASVPANVFVQVLNLGHPTGTPIPNAQKGVVVGSTSCGAYTATVYAHLQDQLEITYEEGLDVSIPQSVFVGMP